jgi:hypothetical protein
VRLDPGLLVEAARRRERHDCGVHLHVLEREPLDAVVLGADLPHRVAVLLGRIPDQLGRWLQQMPIGIDEDEFLVGHHATSSSVSTPSALACSSSSG